MADFIQEQGLPFFAHLLRRLSDEFVSGFAVWNKEVGIKAPPRTHSTLQALAERGPLGVTQLAALLRQSHPLVITWVRQLKELGLVEARSDALDGRRTVLTLTDAGKAETEVQKLAHAAMIRAFEKLMREADAEIFEALWRIEAACRQKSFLDRLREEEFSPSSNS
ncbi:MAG: MarR family winged helix-turn-helix transcriptional regulator [Bryobacteraceae bacterium]